MVDGQLSMVNCQWSMVKCQWSMVNCQWSMVNCELSIVNCQWWIVNGQWSILVLVVVVVLVMCDPSKIKGSCIITHIYVYICIVYPFSFLCFHLIYSIHRLGHPEANKTIAFAKNRLRKKRRREGEGPLGSSPPLSPSFFVRKRFFAKAIFSSLLDDLAGGWNKSNGNKEKKRDK